MLNFGKYMIPLVIGKRNDKNIKLHRYAGIAFFIGEKGLIATCKHVTEMVQPGEVLLGQNDNTGEFYPINNIQEHPSKDFAVGYCADITDYNTFLLTSIAFTLGHDIQAFGYTANRIEDNHIHVDARLRKGYIVRLADLPIKTDAYSLMEISFPAEKGFSGTPLITTKENPNTKTYELVGMIYGNSESSILQHDIREVDDNGNKFTESIKKIVEFGLAHSNIDIIKMLKDLGYDMKGVYQ